MKKTYLIIDAAHMLHRCRHVTHGDIWTKTGLALHIMLGSIKKCWKKFDADHVVFCLEGKSWRKSSYTPYKANRAASAAAKSNKEIEEDEIFYDGVNKFIEFIETRTNCTVLQNPVCEGDDLVARFIQTHSDDNHVLVSSDTDFIQLLKPNVTIYDGVKDLTIKTDGVYDDIDRPLHFSVKSDGKLKIGKPIKKNDEVNYDPEWIEWALFLKFVRGDSGDNIFSAYPRVNVKQIRKAFDDRFVQGFDWINFMNQKWMDHNGEENIVSECYERNVGLIDLTKQPDIIIETMDETISESTQFKDNKQVGLHLLKFAGKYELNRIADNPSDFTSFLTAKY